MPVCGLSIADTGLTTRIPSSDKSSSLEETGRPIL
jgi:hypothetical protein